MIFPFWVWDFPGRISDFAGKFLEIKFPGIRNRPLALPIGDYRDTLILNYSITELACIAVSWDSLFERKLV